MAIELSTEQSRALNADPDRAVRVVDPGTGQVYVLVREAIYSRVESLLADDLSDTYPAQMESALRAGWDDPAIDEYNDYDRHRMI